MKTHLLLPMSALFIVAFWPQMSAQAKTLDVYDLDSLLYESTDVIEGEIVRRYSAHQYYLAEVEITVVHKGTLKKGQMLAVQGTDRYWISRIGSESERPAEKDRLIFFLGRAKTDGIQKPLPDDVFIYTPLPGGMRLIQEGNVFGFWQPMNPGPNESETGFTHRQKKPVTLENFREQIGNSLSTAESLVPILKADEKVDPNRLLKLMAERRKHISDDRDRIGEIACERLAEQHDTEVLSQALALADGFHCHWILQSGFRTPKGRDYLLTKVNDPNEPMESRFRCAYALAKAGEQTIKEPDEGNAGYVTRIAQAALANGNHNDLCVTLIKQIEWLASNFPQHREESQKKTSMEQWRYSKNCMRQRKPGRFNSRLKWPAQRRTLKHTRG